MPDAERSLVSKVAQTGEIEALISRGIDERHFGDPKSQAVWVAMVDHLRAYHSPLSFDRVRERFPAYGFEITSDSLQYLADDFIRAAKRRETVKSMRKIALIVDGDDPHDNEVLDLLFLEEARALAGLVPSSSVKRFSEMPSRIATYLERSRSGFAPGICCGIDAVDELTFGFQPHESIAIVGWAGLGKSSLLQHFIFQAYLQGRTSMIFSLEMEAEALYRKFDTMACQFEYRALKALELSGGDLFKWEAYAERAANAKNDIIVIDDVRNCTVDKIYAETVRYKPDVVAVDYVSLLSAPKQFTQIWERVTYLTAALKQNARSLKVPVFVVAQTNIGSAKGGAEMENIAYSRSIGQDADIVFGLHRDKDMITNHQMELRMLKNRDGITRNVPLYWNPARGEYRAWGAADMFPATEVAA